MAKYSQGPFSSVRLARFFIGTLFMGALSLGMISWAVGVNKPESSKSPEVKTLFSTQLGIEDDLGVFLTAPEAPKVLPQGARVLNLPTDKTFAVLWFPKKFQSSAHRALFILHGGRGNAYSGILHQLNMAKRYGYGLVSLQYRLENGQYLEPKQIYDIFSRLMPYLSKEYGVQSQYTALETYSRSASLSYELAYWDNVTHNSLFKLIISQSGGIPAHNPRPLIRQMLEGKLGDAPLKGARFFLYCGERDQEWGNAMCENVRHAKKVIESEGGTVIRFVDDPVGGHGGLHQTPRHFQSAVDAFMAATPLIPVIAE